MFAFGEFGSLLQRMKAVLEAVVCKQDLHFATSLAAMVTRGAAFSVGEFADPPSWKAPTSRNARGRRRGPGRARTPLRRVEVPPSLSPGPGVGLTGTKSSTKFTICYQERQRRWPQKWLMCSRFLSGAA